MHETGVFWLLLAAPGCSWLLLSLLWALELRFTASANLLFQQTYYW
jgi:hypothetical protein